MKKKIIAGILGAVLIVGAVTSTTGCSLATSSEKKADNKYKYGKIQIPGKDGSLCGAPIYIAYENGYYAEEGFDVELISADSETRKVGLNNGNIPIVNGDFQFFPSMEEGVETTVVDKLHNGCIKLVVKKGSKIRTAKDLKGKKIGVDEIGGTPYQVASVWAEENGISAKQEDGEITFLPFSDGNLELQALYKGEIDVAAMWDPLGSVAEKEGKVDVILDISKDAPFDNKACCFLYASTKVLKEDPGKIAALLRAYRKAQNFINQNPEEAVQIIIDGKYSQISDKELAVSLIKSYDYPSYKEREDGSFDVKADVTYFAEKLNEIKYLKTEAKEFTSRYFAQVDTKEDFAKLSKGDKK